MNEWNIQSRSRHCQACNQHFTDQQPYHTLLFDEKQEFKRMDICEPCWRSQFSEGARHRKGFVSYWQGVYEAPPPPTPDPIHRERAESLLRSIIERKDDSHAAASYILAVMLERKRLLKIKEQHLRDGQRIFLYEQPKTGDLFTIPDPNLQLSQLDQVQREVATLLEHGLTPPAEMSLAPTTAGDAACSASQPAPVSPATAESSEACLLE